jgi:CBS domain-containing protein
MVMLTQMLRYEVSDRSGRRARVADLCIALLEDDYPPVTHVLFNHEGKLREKNWNDVTEIDWKGERIMIDDLESCGEHKDDDKHVLLARDIMDALVLDLLGRRTTRVCDLRLKKEEGTLRLVGADAGLAAMIRRVTRGRFGRIDKESLFDWKYVEFLRGDPSAVENGAGYRLRINRLPAGEIARLADYVPYLHAAELLNLLPDEKAANVLQAMSLGRQLQVIEELSEKEAVGLLERMSPDLATDLIGRLPVDTMRAFLAKLTAKRRDKIIELLRYPENSVGGVMTNDLAVVGFDLTAVEAQTCVNDQIKNFDFISRVFVVDEEPGGKLRGALSLRELLAADPDEKLENLMDPYVATLSPFESAGEAAYRIVGGQLDAMPVVNDAGQLIGAMTIASAISQVVPASSGLHGVRVFS